MEIHEQRHGAVTVLKPVGPLVQADAKDFKARLDAAMTRSLGRLVLDASAIPFVDSAGLGALADAAEEMAGSGQMLRVCGSNETLREVLDLTELAPLFEHFEDATAATRSFL